MRSTWPLVGRDDELQRVAEAMDARDAGLLLIGPAGTSDAAGLSPAADAAGRDS